MMFELLVAKKKKSGKVTLPQSFTETDDTGVERKLGTWLQNQRTAMVKSSFDPERAKKLEAIGVVARAEKRR